MLLLLKFISIIVIFQQSHAANFYASKAVKNTILSFVAGVSLFTGASPALAKSEMQTLVEQFAIMTKDTKEEFAMQREMLAAFAKETKEELKIQKDMLTILTTDVNGAKNFIAGIITLSVCSASIATVASSIYTIRTNRRKEEEKNKM